ncbi:hypothetical protein HDU67_009923 [Dinochytrium kinnereticum]|nr:hypothetical protein HDU67_009923 [Dinochytrium kinnereticum]
MLHPHFSYDLFIQSSYQDSTPLPHGWSSAWDANYGRFYFISPEGTSTWYDPRVSGGPAATATAAGSPPLTSSGTSVALGMSDTRPSVTSAQMDSAPAAASADAGGSKSAKELPSIPSLTNMRKTPPLPSLSPEPQPPTQTSDLKGSMASLPTYEPTPPETDSVDAPYKSAQEEKAGLAAASAQASAAPASQGQASNQEVAGRASMNFSEVPLDGQRASYTVPDSFQSGAPILGAAAPIAFDNNIYDHANYGYTPMEGLNRTTSPLPDPTIQKMFENNTAYNNGSTYANAYNPDAYNNANPYHSAYSSPYDPNNVNTVVPATAQVRDRSGSISVAAVGNTAAVGTYYERGAGAGSGGIHYAALPATDAASSATSSVGYHGYGNNVTTQYGTNQYGSNQYMGNTVTGNRPTSMSPPPGPIGSPPDEASTRLHGRGSLRRGGQSPKDPRRYCCGCFRTRAGCCTVWWLIVLFILGGLGFAGYYLYPRNPTVVVSQPFVPPGEKGLRVSGELASASASAPYTLEFNLMTNVSVFSPNNIDVKVDRLTFAGTLLDDNGKELNARANGQKTSVTFQSRANTTFSLSVNLAYSVTTPSSMIEILALTDPVVAVLARSCGFLGSSRTNLKMAYTTEVSIGLISWTGYKPSFNGRLEFPCPVDSATLLTLLRRDD